MARSAHRHTTAPWGGVAGLLMFSFVTLCGIVLRLEPFVIFQRALISSLIVGIVVQLTVRILTLAMVKRSSSRREPQ